MTAPCTEGVMNPFALIVINSVACFQVDDLADEAR